MVSVAKSDSLLVHGTTVASGNDAVLLRGASGSGKSDLALRFIASRGTWPSGQGAPALVADDQTTLVQTNGVLMASAPPTIAGKMEVRGVGIVAVPTQPTARVRLVVDLVSVNEVARLPDEDATITLLGCQLPLRRLAPFEATAALKLALLLGEATKMGR